MTELILVGIFLLYISVREWQHAKEVRLLSEALIAKNSYEYKQIQTKSEPDKEEVPKFIPEDQASDEEWYKAIQKQLGKESPSDKFKEKIKKLWPTGSTPQE